MNAPRTASVRCLRALWAPVLVSCWLTGACSGGGGGGGGAAADCVPKTVGLDPSTWNSSRGTILGKALGQTFLAVDTLIARITVWRPPNWVDAVGTHLFITAVDTTRTPPEPNTAAILQNGPTVFVRNSEPPGQLIRMDFIIDPPLRLPAPGIYAFFLQREGCDDGETIIIGREPGVYPYGTFWWTGRTSFLPCFLRQVTNWEDIDLIFEIEYCQSAATPIRPNTWGRIKAIYR